MSTPTQRHTKSRKRVRRGAINLKKVTLVKCSKCKKPVKPHTVCKECGTYKGKDKVKVRVPKALRKTKSQEKKDKKQEEKEAKKKDIKKTKTEK